MDTTGLTIQLATLADAADIGHIINEAYEVETGDDGVSFKSCKRLLNPVEEVSPWIAENRTLVAKTETGKILGCIVYELREDHIYFGPFAVDPHTKGKGVGKALLKRIDEIAKENECKYIEITVINHRSDILPMYEKMGYVAVGTEPYPHPERTTRPCHFIVMRRTLS